MMSFSYVMCLAEAPLNFLGYKGISAVLEPRCSAKLSIATQV